MKENKEKILIIDVSAIMYRAHFAMINFRTSAGINNGAILGFIKQLEAAINYFNPKYIIAAKDVKRNELKRREIFPAYKEDRLSMPKELVMQIDDIDNILTAYNIPLIKIPSYEADDTIGSLANKFKDEYDIVILTGDKDLSQLLSNNVKIALIGKKGKTDEEPYYIIENEDDVIEFLGVKSYQIKDLFGLMGDSSDGIPGVKGVGKVSGVKLINQYGNLENLYNNIDEIKGKTKEKLEIGKEMAFISRNLATIHTNLEITLDLKSLNNLEKNLNLLKEIFLKYELRKEYEKLVFNVEEKKEYEKEYEKEELSFSNIIDKINEYAKKELEISIYLDDIALSIYDGNKCYYSFIEIQENLFSNNKSIKDIDNNLKAIVYYNKQWLSNGVNFKNYKDILLVSYTLGSDKSQKIESILFDNLNLSIIEIDKKELKKLKAEELKKLYISRYTNIAYGMYTVYNILEDKLKELNLNDNYEFEKKFTKVLKYMEDNGVKVDLNYFENYSNELKEKINKIENEIYELSGEKFNISSPKQLSYILFEKLEIKHIKKTKTGFSTDADVLELLKERGIEIASKILEYRELEKLNSTYVLPLLKLANNSIIHSTFNQTGTTTGRLSSNNPNLQNIPTRTEEGMKIRKGFVARDGKIFMGFDYSQIELRVLAYLSKDENLINAYKNDLDLHELTARKIFSLKDDEKVEKYQRNIAKVINFSVLYGKSAFGLSKELKISISDAKNYIETYFKEYPKVREYIDGIIEKAKEDLYVETLYRTRRYVYGINSSNANTRESVNRMAVNTVIQGTAANIIKKVMLEIYEKYSNSDIKMLLQVHDELIFEVPEDKEHLSKEIIEIMEKHIDLKEVKLKVNYNFGKSWMELK